MDVVADELVDERHFRALTVIDLFTRAGLAIADGRGLGGQDVAATLERPRFGRGLQPRISCDHGTESVSAAMDLWAYTNGVVLAFSRRGTPTDDATIDSFGRRCLEKCVHVHWFASLKDAQQTIDAFRWEYNQLLSGLSRASALGNSRTRRSQRPRSHPSRGPNNAAPSGWRGTGQWPCAVGPGRSPLRSVAVISG